MKELHFLAICFILSFAAVPAGAEHSWVNNISVSEYGVYWNYTDTFTGIDSISYRMSIDRDLGNNDSFISAWEVLKADKELRKKFRGSIDKEFDVKINNENGGIELVDVDTNLANDLIGKTNSFGVVINRYNISYRLKDRFFNASSIWFLGQADSPVTIIMPQGINIINIRGMKNINENITDHSEISGSFKPIDNERGEITLNLTWNMPAKNELENITVTESPKNETKPISENLSEIWVAGMIILGLMLVFLIYMFKIRKRE